MQRTTALALASFLSLITVASAQEGKKAQDGLYAKGVIDLGIVVRDLDRSAKFYTEVLGLRRSRASRCRGR